MKWTLRIRQWAEVYNHEAKAVPHWRLWIKIGRALLSGSVPRRVYIRRLRTCMRCPVYDPIRRVCRPRDPAYAHLGCGCFVPFVALTANPYGRGCWGHSYLNSVGWPAFEKKNPDHS